MRGVGRGSAVALVFFASCLVHLANRVRPGPARVASRPVRNALVWCARPGELDDSCYERALESGAVIELPAGIYLFSKEVRSRGLHDMVIRGRGPATVLVRDGPLWECDSCANVIVENLSLRSRTTPLVVRASGLPTAHQDGMIVLDRWGTGSGYIPTVNDIDVWRRLSRSQRDEQFDTGLVFVRPSGVRVTHVSGDFFSLLFYDASRCRVDHSRIVGGKNFAGAVAFWRGSGATRGNHFDVIDHNFVWRSAYSGIFIGGGDHFTVESNTVVGAGESGIKTGEDKPERVSRSLIVANSLVNSWYDGLDLSSSHPHTSAFEADSVAVGNRSTANHATGLYADGRGWVVADNIFAHNFLAGVKSDLVNSVISGNCVVDNNRSGSRVENQLTVGSGIAPAGDLVAGNIVVVSRRGPGYGIFVGGRGAVLVGNTVVGAPVYWPGAALGGWGPGVRGSGWGGRICAPKD